jgi:hypothetical protein
MRLRRLWSRASPARDQRVEPRSHSTPHHVGPGFYLCRVGAVQRVSGARFGNRRRLIHVKVAMSEDHSSTNEVICPVSGRPMILLHTIWRAFGENLNVFKCEPCGFSTTEPMSWTTPPS